MASDFQSAVIKTVQGIGYLSTFILSLVITIPMSMNQDQFKGNTINFWPPSMLRKEKEIVLKSAKDIFMSNCWILSLLHPIWRYSFMSFIFNLLLCSFFHYCFTGRCLLFSTGQWQEMDGQFVVQWASQAYCNFTIFVAGKDLQFWHRKFEQLVFATEPMFPYFVIIGSMSWPKYQISTNWTNIIVQVSVLVVVTRPLDTYFTIVLIT